MVTFAVPEYQSVAHFVLGILLDRARLDRISCDGRFQLKVNLLQEDVRLFEEMGIFQGDCASLEVNSLETDNQAAIHVDFEKELTALQRKVEASLAKAQILLAD